MNDDIEAQLRDRLRNASLPGAPDDLRDYLDDLTVDHPKSNPMPRRPRGEALLAAAAVLVVVGLSTAGLAGPGLLRPPSGPGATVSTVGAAAATPRPSISPAASASPDSSPFPALVESLPNLSVQNGTTLTVSLFVNGQFAGDFASNSWTPTIETSGLPPLPWIVEARSPSGRVLTSMDVQPGDVQSTISPNGDEGFQFESGKGDLSCGRIRILAGWTRSAPPPYGAIPTPPSHSAPTTDDCAP
jgi:hypothetical protein